MTKRLVCWLGLVLLAGCPDDGEATTTDGEATTGGATTSGPSSSMSASSTDGSSGGSSGEPGSSSSSGPGEESGSSESSSGSSSTGGSTVVDVPAPCPDEQFDFGDIEPNDTPEQAVDACTVSPFYWGNFQAPSTLGGGDEVDWVVFATPDNGGAGISIPIFPCWTGGGNLVDIYVYEVVGGQADLGMPVYTAASEDEACEGQADVDLDESAVYLLELRLANPAAPETEFVW